MRLRKNSNFFDLGNIKYITIVKNSTIFKYDKIKGSHSLPFNLPLTQNNNKLFNFHHHLTKLSDDVISINNVELLVGLNVFSVGTLQVNQTDKNYNCTFILDTGNFFYKIQDLDLQDIPFETKPFVSKSDYNNTDDDFALFTLHAPNYFNDILAGFELQFYSYTQTINKYIAGEINMFIDVLITCPIIPFPFLNKVLQKIFNYFGFVIAYNFLESTEELKNLIVYNNRDCRELVQEDFKWSPKAVNYNVKNHLPYISISEFLKNIISYFNLSVNVIANKVYIYSNEKILADSDTIDITNISNKKFSKTFIKQKQGFELRNNLQEDDLINLVLNNQQVAFLKADDEIESVILPDYNSLPANAEDGSIFLTKHSAKDDKFVFFKKFTNILVNSYSSYFDLYSNAMYQNYVEPGQRNFIIETKTGVLQNNNNIYNPSVDMLPHYPYTKDVGNTVFNLNKEFKSLKLMFYRGVQKYGQWYYPCGGSTRENPVSGLNTGSYLDATSLQFYGDKGVFKSFWKYTAKYLQQKTYTIEREILFSFADLKFFDFTKKYVIDSVPFFIEKLQYQININGSISPTTTTLRKAY